MKKIYKNVAYRKCLTQDKEGYLIKSVLGGKKVIRHSLASIKSLASLVIQSEAIRGQYNTFSTAVKSKSEVHSSGVSTFTKFENPLYNR